MKSKIKPIQYNTTTIRVFTNVRVAMCIELKTD